MILNNIEVKILASMKLTDAYNNLFPEDFIMENVIYCIHNEVNGKNYIGQTVKVENRFSKTYVGHFRDYERYISGELKKTRVLYKAWKKYGLESFSVFIIDTGIDREELNQKEMYWIKTLHTCTKDPECFGYNLSWGADDMGVKDPDSIRRSLETRKRIYGDYFPNCHTQEAYDKGNKTKEERYGHGGFVNAFTPEANEKRRQTNLERYGTTHGPKISKEAIDKMVKEKIEKFGDPMGICNTPENREKARKNLAKTRILGSIQNNLSTSSIKISCFNEYYKHLSVTYSNITSVNYHIKQIFKYLPDLRTDDRWNDKLESIFQDLINMSEEDLNNMIKTVLKNRRKEAWVKRKRDRRK